MSRGADAEGAIDASHTRSKVDCGRTILGPAVVKERGGGTPRAAAPVAEFHEGRVPQRLGIEPRPPSAGSTPSGSWSTRSLGCERRSIVDARKVGGGLGSTGVVLDALERLAARGGESTPMWPSASPPLPDVGEVGLAGLFRRSGGVSHRRSSEILRVPSHLRSNLVKVSETAWRTFEYHWGSKHASRQAGR